jgi:2-hydroxychromene-2-carboxylate isomerase
MKERCQMVSMATYTTLTRRLRVSVDFFFDYRSPYAYLANTQIGTWEVPVDYEPVDIVAVMRKVNNQPSPLCPPKARYAGIDAKRWAKHYDVAFSPNETLLQAISNGQLDGTLLSRIDLAARELRTFEQVNDALFEAVWAGRDDLVTEAGRAAFLKARHIVADGLWNLASDPKIVKLLAQRNQEAVERGVFGVPTMFVDGEMFFGNDRLHFVQARLQISAAHGAAANER